MPARLARIIASAALALPVAACSNSLYEIAIATPVRSTLDVSSFQRALVPGFIAGGTDEVDLSLETVRVLRSQLRTRSSLKVLEADPLPLAELAIEPTRTGEEHDVPGDARRNGDESIQLKTEKDVEQYTSNQDLPGFRVLLK